MSQFYALNLSVHRQIPARYWAYASHAEELYLKQEKFDIDTLINETTCMRKKNFYSYRWLMYWHELDQKTYYSELAKVENAMIFRDEPQRVKAIVQ